MPNGKCFEYSSGFQVALTAGGPFKGPEDPKNVKMLLHRKIYVSFERFLAVSESSDGVGRASSIDTTLGRQLAVAFPFCGGRKLLILVLCRGPFHWFF